MDACSSSTNPALSIGTTCRGLTYSLRQRRRGGQLHAFAVLGFADVAFQKDAAAAMHV